MTHHRPGVPNFGLTEREVDLVRQVNLDLDMRPDGFFRINNDCFECDACGARLPTNAKGGDDEVSDFYISGEGTGPDILCRLCANGFPDENQTGLINPPPDPDAALNKELDHEATEMMGKILPFNRPKGVRPDA